MRLAIELGIRHVLIDGIRGRRVARLLGLGERLLRAKREGHTVAVPPSLDDFWAHGIWLGRRVYDVAGREAGER